jgi:hypothetical protein
MRADLVILSAHSGASTMASTSALRVPEVAKTPAAFGPAVRS